MSLLKKLKELAKENGVDFKKNAKEAKMKELLSEAEVDYSHLEEEKPKAELGATSPKKGREADNVSALNGESDGLFFLGNCVKTGKPLYKKLK